MPDFPGVIARRCASHFAKYLAVGVIWTILPIASLWLLIDHWRLPAIWVSAIVYGALFVTKYTAYVFIGMLKADPVKYILVAGVFSALNVFIVWLFVDCFHLPAASAGLLNTTGLFLARFFAFSRLGILRDPPDKKGP
ncbi:MAG: hypothetical protein A3G34_11765 [Candidatus Lindowbacteria bacterium RIFCSPLOWO2_12_FULL_62_27]|nr:MAG: hypothetical protein A3G34_11765 [Candidatus Lindowbacteria bacterium RIFCSPLOWO2_12_FULL_62_27]OGH56167.1 MAG: hypothetical protein A3I06_01805 [Candidatus Lindowbacteria bacterium RIFCSPLOWO2_02_FULL_62_12]